MCKEVLVCCEGVGGYTCVCEHGGTFLLFIAILFLALHVCVKKAESILNFRWGSDPPLYTVRHY